MKLVRQTTRRWHLILKELLRTANQEILVCSPFVGREGTTFVVENVAVEFSKRGRLTFLTNLSVAHVCQLSTDPRALKTLLEVLPQSTVFHVPGLHAKVYIADEAHAIVTSGNLTAAGLFRNLEYGLEVRDQALVRRMRMELVEFAHLGAAVPPVHLVAYCDALEKLYEPIEREQQLARRKIRQEFQQALRPIEDNLLRLRLAGGPIHTVFARTIEYLLRAQGPLTTVEIHPMVASIHPDLCDDSVDRVIDGKRFGKKWKHAVRTAQQYLKKQGRIKYARGVWSLGSTD